MAINQSDLPISWVMASLGDVASKPQYGWTTKAAADGENLKLLRTSDISSGRVNWDTVPTCLDEPPIPAKYFLDPGDIVVARAGSVGKSFLIRERVTDAVFASYLVRFRPQIRPEYIDLFMQSRLYWEQIEDKSSGIAIPNVNASKLAAVTLPVAPRSEQDRIVEKIETLFAELDKGEEALREVQKLLASYRQSVLKAAVTGTLTADWRAANGPPQESGADLLARILKTRRESWQGRGEYKEPVEPNTDGLPELPSGWVWVSIHQILRSDLANGKSVPDAEDGFPVLRLTALKDGGIDLQERKVGAWDAKAAENFLVNQHDVLVSRGNGSKRLVGLGGIVSVDPDGVAYPDTMIRISPQLGFVLADWFIQTWNGPFLRSQIEASAKTTAGIYKINQGDIRSFAMPLPPMAEQEAMATLVEENLAQARVAEGWCETELNRSAALRQSILKDAFSGKLVPQDPSDEPADKLLERIRAAREEKPRAKRKKANA